jgi:CsoR family transcriptional regulator, copper-sensing transcriptional repressor
MMESVGGEELRSAPGGIKGPAAAGDPGFSIVACGCGCASAETPGGSHGDGSRRHAVAVDPETKERNLKRLRRIEGQVRGLQRMVEEERYCADIMTQIASAQEALRGVGRELMRNHLKHCAAQALRSEDPERAEAMYDELLELMYKHVR